jgi:thymidylate synthase
MAAASSGPGELAERYRRVYPTLRRLHKNNQKGIYFHRIVAYPSAGGEVDQLAELIRRLRTELRTPGPKSARYEMNVSGAGDSTESHETCSASELTDATPVSVYAADRDTSAMAFPCLSFCSFQLAGDTLHMVAQYRYQYLIQRGYGNYLGLGQLLGYVCSTVGLKPGELMVVAGVAAADAPHYQVVRLTAAAQAQ